MEESNILGRLSLHNAFKLLEKVLGDEDNKFTREDWQMLQVAQFLVSKEKFLRRDSDNMTLHFGLPRTSFLMDDLCDQIYDIARYVYNHDSTLIIDSTKVLDYQGEIPERFKNRSNPSFDEALIIVNMIRNSIVHGQARLDFDHSLLLIDNQLERNDFKGVMQFKINVAIPLSLLSAVDLGRIVKQNYNEILRSVFEAIGAKSYRFNKKSVDLDVEYKGEIMTVNVSREMFAMLLLTYERGKNRLPSIVKPVEDIEYEKLKNVKMSLQRSAIYKSLNAQKGKVDFLKTSKDVKDLISIMELINNDKNKALDPSIVQKFRDLMESEHLPADLKVDAMMHFSDVVKSIDYQENTEESLDSLSIVFGSQKQERIVDFVALYNYMTFLFAECPLKEGNSVLTEFIDFSTIYIDLDNTKDEDIKGFYVDIIQLITEANCAFYNDSQYGYQIPCINLYAKIIATIEKKLKIRNNAYIRHIRNAIEHSNVSLTGDIVELKDYMENGDEVDKTFRSRISMDSLVRMSLSYSSLYDVNGYPEYRSLVNDSKKYFLSYTFDDLFRELEKGIDSSLIMCLKSLLKDLHQAALGEEFSYDNNLADVTAKLADTALNLKASGKRRGGKS